VKYLFATYASLLVGACSVTPQFEGWETAVAVNQNTNSEVDYSYSDRPKGYTPTAAMEKGGSGNCADFAVTKCQLLVDAGFAQSRLSMSKFINKDGIGHAVCVVDGMWALDWYDYPVALTQRDLMAKSNIHPYLPNFKWRKTDD